MVRRQGVSSERRAVNTKMKKLRVLVSAYACLSEVGAPVAGGEAVLGWNCVQQLARFHDVWVLTPGLNRPQIEAAVQGQNSLVFCYVDLPRWLRPILKLPSGIQLYAYLWQIQAYRTARKLHARLKFDAFHHITYANDWMASYTGAFLPVPYFRGPGGGAHRTPKAFLREYSLQARVWEAFRSFGQRVLRLDPIFRLGQRRAKVILLCNREAKEAVPRSLRHKAQLFPVNGISAEDLRILGGEDRQRNPNGEPSQDRLSPGGGTFEVLYAGKLLGLKGVALGIRAFAMFADRHSDARFMIVGDGPERARLESLIEALGVKECAHLKNWMPRSEVLALMRGCDVFLFPSLRDGGGGVVVEAMAAGKPVVCLDLAGPGLHVTEECGIKIPARTRDEAIGLMARALERLYEDRELRMKMGEAARRRVQQHYHWDHLGERLLGIYTEVLGGPSQEA